MVPVLLRTEYIANVEKIRFHILLTIVLIPACDVYNINTTLSLRRGHLVKLVP